MANDPVQHLGVEYGHRFFASAFAQSSEAKAISEEMTRQGLEAQSERTHVFSVFSRDSLKSLAISVTPFSGKNLNYEGGLSLSEGGHAQGVIVELKNHTEIVGFTHLAVTNGKLVTSKHGIKDLSEGRPTGSIADDHIQAVAERAGKIKTAKPLVEIDARQVRSLASISYNGLLGDSFSATVHDEREVAALRGNTSLVSEIALFVLFRTSGSSCCSCSCSCWGSSSCSSSYVK
jgi:hypothetical protein